MNVETIRQWSMWGRRRSKTGISRLPPQPKKPYFHSTYCNASPPNQAGLRHMGSFSRMDNGLDQFFIYWVRVESESRKEIDFCRLNIIYPFMLRTRDNYIHSSLTYYFNSFAVVSHFTDFPLSLTTKCYSLTLRPSDSRMEAAYIALSVCFYPVLFCVSCAFILFCFVFLFSEMCVLIQDVNVDVAKPDTF